jgi:hypothetical protein
MGLVALDCQQSRNQWRHCIIRKVTSKRFDKLLRFL